MKIEELRVGQIVSYGSGNGNWRAKITKIFNPPRRGDAGILRYGERLVLISGYGEEVEHQRLLYEFERGNVASYFLIKNIPPEEEMKPTGIKPVFEYMDLLK